MRINLPVVLKEGDWSAATTEGSVGYILQLTNLIVLPEVVLTARNVTTDHPDAVTLEVLDAEVRVEDSRLSIISDWNDRATLTGIAITATERQLETRGIVFKSRTTVVDVVV